MKPALRAVIFDFDGTLVDSEPNNLAADRQLLARFGVDFTEADKRPYIGGRHLDMWIELRRKHGLTDPPQALAAAKDALCIELADATRMVYPAMRRFVEQIRDRGLPLAVASGSSRVLVERLLAAVGLDPFFETVVSAEEVPHGKPAPDVFLEAARRLGVPPHACAVVEDSPPGVEAAHRASMPCIAVPSLLEVPLPPAFALAELLFPGGMASFDPAEAISWVEARMSGQHSPRPARP